MNAIGPAIFQDAERARLTFSRLAQKLSPSLSATLSTLLFESPDPDSALLFLDRLVAESGDQVLSLLNRHPVLAHYAIVVFGHSHFLGETLLQNPDLLQAFLREKNLDRSFSREEFQEALARFRSRTLETDVSLLLARFKRREFVRIMLRDALKLAPLAETTAEISALADVLIAETLRDSESVLQSRYGLPQHVDGDGRLVAAPFAVLSLGKLGGNELNYSSDVDLFYVFGDGEEAPSAPISNQEYFVRLAQQVTESLSRVTSEGPVFRIDMRLRPQGNQGELAVNLGYALHYYAEVAQDWERQALIKMRYTAGNLRLAREFIRRVQPHIYGAPDRINFAAIETALQSRARISARRNSGMRKQAGIDVKRDRGGIRDIEFLVQCLQRVYGGGETWLRSGGTLFSLHKLHDRQHISSKDFQQLTAAYEFLRHLEHRLQLQRGQQTHRLPASAADLAILHKSMEAYLVGEYKLTDLESAVLQRMAAVSEIYQRIIHQQHERREQQQLEPAFELRSPASSVSPDAPEERLLAQLANDLPAMHARVVDLDPHARRGLLRFLASALRTSGRYAAVVRNPTAAERALAIFETSDFLSEILIRYPEEIATLADLRAIALRMGSGYLFHPEPGRVLLAGEEGAIPPPPASDPVFAYIAASGQSYSEKLALLRQHYRHLVFTSGAKDISDARDVYQSLATNTAAADDAITAAFQIAGSPTGLAVLALGRLGSEEFDLLSDADLLFVCDESADLAVLRKATEQIIHSLAAYTRDGLVFPVDARLRPHGGQGELLVTPAQLRSYFQKDAKPWEALVYTKLRFICGAPELAKGAANAARELPARFAGDREFVPAIREMRVKLEHADSGELNFKSSAGAIYDIEFLCSYLGLKGGTLPQAGTLRERLWACVAAGALNNSDAAFLDHAAELFRTAEHITRLVVGRRQKWLPTTEHSRNLVQKLTGRILGRSFLHGLEGELNEVRTRTRQIYESKLQA